MEIFVLKPIGLSISKEMQNDDLMHREDLRDQTDLAIQQTENVGPMLG